MATAAHGLYCFEVLTASLDRRIPLALHQVQELWKQYKTAELDDEAKEAELEGGDDDDDEEEVDARDGEHEAIDMELEGADSHLEEPASRRPRIRSGLERLAVPSPASASSSSAPSTVSSSSASSRKTASNLSSSSNSSASSFFSVFGRKVQGRNAQHQQAQSSHGHEDSPLFVTWNTLSRTGTKTLRGCIGTFEAQELESGLRSYALTSAFDDSRFMPITKRELQSLEVGVTLLTNFEPSPTPTSWTLGTHGLRISFTYHNKRYGATYLPDVPVDQGWTKEETLVSLMRKAGWSGRKEEWRKVGDLRVVRYQGKKVSVPWEEWMEWRAWVESTGLLGPP